MKTVINQFIESYVRKEKYYSDLAKVVSVDDNKKIAIVEILNSKLQTKTRTQATIESTGGFYMKPKVDSYVVVNWISKELCFISLYSEIDATIYQNGDNLGVPITPHLVDRLNIIENDINDLKQILGTTWIPVASDGGAALKTAAATWAGLPLDETDDDDIQNENFLQ